MHKSSRIKNKINELKKHIVLSEEEFISYCEKQKDIHLYPSYITNSRLLNNFYEKYPKAVSLRFEGENFCKINKEKLEVLIRNNYFKVYGQNEIPGQIIKNIKDKKTYDYLMNIYKEQYSNDDILEYSQKELYFLKIKKNSLKMRVLNNGGLNHFNFYYDSKISIDQYLFFINHCNDVSKIDKMLQTTSNYIEEIIPLLDVSFYENLVRKNINLSSLDSNFLFFAKNKEVIDYLINNGLFIDKSNILSMTQIKSLRKISFNSNMIHNILYLSEIGCILDPEIKENKNNVIYKILSSRKSDPDDVLKTLKNLKSLNWNLKYDPPKKRIPRTDVINFPWLKNKEIIDYVIDNDFISKETVFKKADFRNNDALLMYMVREHSQILMSNTCLDHLIDILSSKFVSSEARWRLVNEIENTNYEKTMLNCFLSNADLFKDVVSIREKWRFLKYIIKNKDNINSLKPLFFKPGITKNMYNYIIENTGFDVNSINGEGENILFYVRSEKMVNYFLNKGVDSTLKNNKKEACFLNYYEKKDIVSAFSNKETFVMDDAMQAVFINKILSSDFSVENKNQIIEFYDNKEVFSFIKNANSLTVANLFDNNIEKEHVKYLEEFFQVKEELKKVVRIITFMSKCHYYKDDDVVENYISYINTCIYKEDFLENNPELRELLDLKFFHTVYNLIGKKSVALKPLLEVFLSLYGDSLFQSIKEKDYFFDGFRKEYTDWFNNILLEMQSHSEFEKIKNELSYIESGVNKKKRM